MSEARTVDLGDSRKYRTEIPNLVFALGLSPFELALYVHLKKTAGAEGACWKSTQTLSEETGMSAGMVSRAKEGLQSARLELGGKSLINVSEEANRNGGRPRHIITITDIWPENFAANARPSSPHERASSPHEVASSPGELKKEPGEERTPEETNNPSRACAAFVEVYGHPPHIHGQEDIDAEGIDDFDLWLAVLTQCKGNLTPAKNTGTMLRFYREQRRRAREKLERRASQAPRGSPDGWHRAEVTVDHVMAIEGCSRDEAERILRE